MKLSRGALLAAIAASSAVVMILGGCGGAEGDAGPVTVTVVEGASAAAQPLVTPTKTSSDDVLVADSEGAEAAVAEEEAPSEACDGIIVPDVTGGDHQLAQDTMQAAGLYNLSEEDATGNGRLLLYDRNWTVVRQKPKAGGCVSEDTTIILYSKKDDE